MSDYDIVESSKVTITSLMKKVLNWWSNEGYVYASGTSFTQEGWILASLSVSAETKGLKSQEDYVAELRSKGYTIGGEEPDYAFMVDNDNNRKIIRKVIKDRFPSARILEWVNNRQVGPDNEDFLLKKIRIEIRDISEI